MDFVAEVLDNISSQLCGSSERLNNRKDQVNLHAKKVELPKNHSLESLHEALRSLVKSLDRAFLILDDLDACGPMLSLLLEDQLSWLQQLGVSILVTSRVPHQKNWELAYCDVDTHCDVDPNHRELDIYWKCKLCLEDDYVICDMCKEQKHACLKR